ncbi:MAG TPA: hypothetical protein VF117_08635 [Gammaproteobacteria bacterium]
MLMKYTARYFQLNRYQKQIFFAGIAFDALLVLVTCVGAWNISSDPATQLGLLGSGVVLSGGAVISFNQNNLWTESYEFWSYFLIASVIGTGIVIQTNLVYWHLIVAVVEERSSDVSKLWAQQKGGLFVFIGIMCIYSSLFGFIRSAYIRLIRKLLERNLTSPP